MRGRTTITVLACSVPVLSLGTLASGGPISQAGPAIVSSIPHTERGIPVSIDTAWLAATIEQDTTSLSIPLPDGPSAQAMFDSFEIGAPGRYTAIGRTDRGDTVFLVARDGIVLADIIANDGTAYQLRTTPNRSQVVRRVTHTQFAPCGCGSDHAPQQAANIPMDTSSLIAGAIRRATTRNACVEDGSFIDLLVAYTDVAATAEGGTVAMEALIDLALLETNQALASSGVATTIRLAAAVEVPKTWSTTSSASILNYMPETGDGHLDQLHALRDQHRADLVTLIVNSLDVCGRAYIGVAPGPTPLPELGFNVVLRGCAAAPVYALAHELGHNCGLNHDRAAAPCDANGSRFAHGYIEPAETFSTIMATGTTAPGILNFSNPNVLHLGAPTGIANDSDNAASLALTAPIVANYRSLDCDGNGVCDTDDIAGGADDLDGNGVLDTCEQDYNSNGVVDAFDISSAASLDTNANAIPDEAEPVRIYVDPAATGTGLGDSWTDARPDLQVALNIASRSSGLVQEIWVAAGLYTPGPAPERARRFQLANGCTLYGGFAGNETSLAERDWRANPTILSGDLLGDDGPGFTNTDDNSVSVVWASYTDNTAAIDGFFIEGGNCDFNTSDCWFTPSSGGGAIRSFAGGATIRNCVIQRSTANNGGGVFIVHNGSPDFYDCDFIDNRAIGSTSDASGGGVFDNSSSADSSYENCRFLGNYADSNGGALTAICSNANVAGCLFSGNIARSAAGLQFTGACADTIPVVSNSTFSHNLAWYGAGGGLYAGKSDPLIHNCVFWGNEDGGGAREAAQFSPAYASTHVMTHCIMEHWSGTLGGVTNNGLDPLFTDADGADDTLGTNDDDPRPASGSPAIDSGDNAMIPLGLTTDLDGAIRRVDDPGVSDSGAPVADVPYVDRGAYERQAPPSNCSGDLDGDGDTDVFDFGIFGPAFGSSGLPPFTGGDLDGDGDVDVFDFGIFGPDFGCTN